MLGAPVGQHSAQLDAVLVEQRHGAVVQQVGGGDGRFAVMEFGEAHLATGVDEGLLADAPDAFQGADAEGVLGAAVAAPQ